jgi:c-di-GMP-binding flagellar brake protein YcgR
MDMIRLNGKIEIISEDGNTTQGMVMDKTDRTIDFSIPADDKRFKLFHKNEKIKAVVFDKNKAVIFEAVVADRVTGGVPTYTLTDLAGFKNIQRRENVRVSCSAPLNYTTNKFILDLIPSITDTAQAVTTISKYMKEGIMIDLSAGGVKFSCDENLNDGQKMLFQLCLDNEPIIITGTLVHKQITVNPNSTKYFYGIKFDSVDEDTKEQIINHVFVIMRKQTRK